MENTEMPRMKTQALVEAARHRKPTVPITMPATMVGSGRVFLTIRLTSTWSRMMVPPLTTVTCSASNLRGMPIDAKNAFTGVASTKSRRYHSTDPKFWK